MIANIERAANLFLVKNVYSVVLALITVVIAEISWRGWVAGMKALVKGETLLRSPVGWKSASPELRPIARDLQALVLDLESERRARDEQQRDPGRYEEWSYLFVHLRQFATPDGFLPGARMLRSQALTPAHSMRSLQGHPLRHPRRRSGPCC